MPVSRETASPEQTVLDRYWPSDASAIKRYVELLSHVGPARGLIGPREVERLWVRHIFNCVVLSPLIEADAAVADIGSGAGLPGLVLASARADLSMTLVEPMLRRSIFLHEAVETMKLRNTHVVRVRAEELHGTQCFTVVTARALAPLERLVRWCLPLVSPGGCLLAMKGNRGIEELNAARPYLRDLGVIDADIVSVGAGVLPEPTTVVRIVSP